MSDILNTLLGEFDSEDGGISGADLHHLAFLLVKERKDLQDKLKIAVEALEHYATVITDPDGFSIIKAQAALKLIRETDQKAGKDE